MQTVLTLSEDGTYFWYGTEGTYTYREFDEFVEIRVRLYSAKRSRCLHLRLTCTIWFRMDRSWYAGLTLPMETTITQTLEPGKLVLIGETWGRGKTTAVKRM